MTASPRSTRLPSTYLMRSSSTSTFRHRQLRAVQAHQEVAGQPRHPCAGDDRPGPARFRDDGHRGGCRRLHRQAGRPARARRSHRDGGAAHAARAVRQRAHRPAERRSPRSGSPSCWLAGTRSPRSSSISTTSSRSTGGRHARGDLLLRHVSELILESVGFADCGGSFVGHMGADDFVVICNSEAAESVAHEIAKAFDLSVMDFYEDEDRERGFFILTTRSGNATHYGPLHCRSGSPGDRLVSRFGHHAHRRWFGAASIRAEPAGQLGDGGAPRPARSAVTPIQATDCPEPRDSRGSAPRSSRPRLRG